MVVFGFWLLCVWFVCLGGVFILPIFNVFLLFDVENRKEKLGKMKELNDTVLILGLKVHFHFPLCASRTKFATLTAGVH